MTIKIFTKNEKGKIELSVDELQSLLNTAYNEGYAAKSKEPYYTINTITTPYVYTTNSIDKNTVTISSTNT